MEDTSFDKGIRSDIKLERVKTECFKPNVTVFFLNFSILFRILFHSSAQDAIYFPARAERKIWDTIQNTQRENFLVQNPSSKMIPMKSSTKH